MAAEDQQDLQRFLVDFDKEMDNNDDDGNVVLTIQTEVDEEDDEDDEGNNGTIIMDAEGNYYFQTSNKMVEVKQINKESSLKKVAATIVAKSTPKSLKQTKLEDGFKKTRKYGVGIVIPNADETLPSEIDENDEYVYKQNEIEDSFKKTKKDEMGIVIPNADETLPSEIDENDEHIYEFDETEQYPDDPLSTAENDYGTKALIKPIKIAKPIEAASSFTCMLCSYETNKKFLLSRHLKTHCDDRPYKCAVCERGFKTNASLMNHTNTHLGNKPHACKDCEKTFTTSGELVRHVRYRHTHIKPHKCTECDYSSVEMSKLRRHMRCHTGERPYQCPHCTYASPDTFKLKRHLRTHTGEKPYQCDICLARFTQSNSLKYHRLIHSVNDKPVFQCHLCPTTCGRKTDLRLHIKKLHNSEQPIPCNRCGKELPDRYSYKMHVKTHEGEKCYRCTYCPYASITQRHLESHMLIHTDTKPFVCDICKMTFRQKQLLTRHMKVYHTNDYEPPPPRKKDHKCPHCEKTFAFNGNLIRHMETHDPSSQISEERQKLRMGRMKRVQADGSVVTFDKCKLINSLASMFSEENQYIEEETEEQLGESEVYEEAYEEYNNEMDDIQYVYEDFEADDQEETEGGELLDTVLDIKLETETMPNIKAVPVKKETDDADIMAVEVDDGQSFMVIEVMPDDEELVAEHEQELEPEKVVHNNNRNANKATVIKNATTQSTIVNDTNCFGFEVDEDEDDEETKGAIKLLQLIEQD